MAQCILPIAHMGSVRTHMMWFSFKRLKGHCCRTESDTPTTSLHCRHKGRWQTLRDCVVKVTFFLAISYLLVVPAFFFFHLLLGLFPLFLQLILFLLVPLLSWDVQRTFGSDHRTPSLGCSPSSKAPCTIHYKILFTSEHLESNACTP